MISKSKKLIANEVLKIRTIRLLKTWSRRSSLPWLVERVGELPEMTPEDVLSSVYSESFKRRGSLKLYPHSD
jgi:hypothetical protein